MRFSAIYIIIIGVLLCSCDKDDVKKQAEETLVVQGVLMAGELVDNIKILRLDNPAFGLSSTGVSGAKVILSRGSNEFVLSENPLQEGVYEYNGEDLEIAAGGVYNLEVCYENEQIKASTQIPDPIILDEVGGLDISVDTMSFGEVVFEISWEEMPYHLALLSLENLEEEPSEIPFIVNSGTFDFFYSKPIQEIQASIMDIDFKYYGQNRLSIFLIHPEYEKLFLNLNQLNGELATSGSDNIVGGVGYFTAVNRTSVIINVQ